ncbi:MAG: UPF0280 family protein [candidate division WOR-3 bacterium]
MKPYRERVSGWPYRARIVHRKTDILLGSENPIDATPGARIIVSLWEEMEGYLERHPVFGRSLDPLEPLPGAPAVAINMAQAGKAAGVGPMAAVAGAFAERVVMAYHGDVAAENGGDVFMRTSRERVFEVFSGNPKLPGPRITVPPGSWGIATSSGKLGLSLSLGRAWAATVVAESGALADAWATRLGNEALLDNDPEGALLAIKGAEGVFGALVITEESLAVWGLKLK